MHRACAITAIAALGTVLAGCAGGMSGPKGQSFQTAGAAGSIDEVYGKVHREGARDAVDLLREGLRSDYTNGARDPGMPIRQPAEVIPVYRPAHTDPQTGRRVEGHWEHSVVRFSEWAD